MIKEQLAPKDISDLTSILEDCATIRIEAKSDRWQDYPAIMYIPSIRIQTAQGLETYRDRFGGSFSQSFFRTRPKETWVWNIEMIKQYLPLLIPRLSEKTRKKAEIVLEATKYCYGRGKEQDKEKLKELFEKLLPLQEPRIRRPDFPWLEKQEFPF